MRESSAVFSDLATSSSRSWVFLARSQFESFSDLQRRSLSCMAPCSLAVSAASATYTPTAITDWQNSWKIIKFKAVCEFCEQALLQLLYILTTSTCRYRRDSAANVDDEVFVDSAEKQPLLRRHHKTEQTETNMQHSAQYLAVDSTDVKLVGDV